MKKPVLAVMAAGMGSRYGGLKQIDPVGSHGQLIIDYSIFDARRAGFETVVFIIKHEIEEAFRQAVGDRISKVMEVRYVFQELDDLPQGYSVPEGRTKPWGTAHAVLAARDVIDGRSPSSTQTTTTAPRRSPKFTATSRPTRTRTACMNTPWWAIS